MPDRQQIQQSSESKSTVKKQTTPRIQAPSSHPASIIQRARINPKSLTHADVMQLQRTIGNRAVGRLLSEIGLIPSKPKQAPPVQRQELVQRQEIPEEEEPLQGKFESGLEKETCPSCMQRQEIPEEEEPLQGKMIGTIQRQEVPEEEERLQDKMIGTIQRQEIPEEEEPLQDKMIGTIQRQEIPEEEEPLQRKRENNTGMPDNLKAGVENLSGIDMSDVRVHYNSDKPAKVGALAYTQGTNIHVAPGQENHLPHEGWHVVQQMQGRVSNTGEVRGLPLNDSRTLESEADLMGRKALQQYARVEKQKGNKSRKVANSVAQKKHNRQQSFGFVDNRPMQKKINTIQRYLKIKGKTWRVQKGLEDNKKDALGKNLVNIIEKGYGTKPKQDGVVNVLYNWMTDTTPRKYNSDFEAVKSAGETLSYVIKVFTGAPQPLIEYGKKPGSSRESLGIGLKESSETRKHAEILKTQFSKVKESKVKRKLPDYFMLGVMTTDDGSIFVSGSSSIEGNQMFKFIINALGYKLAIQKTVQGYSEKFNDKFVFPENKKIYGTCAFPQLITTAVQYGLKPTAVSEMLLDFSKKSKGIDVPVKGYMQHFEHGTFVPSCPRCLEYSHQQLEGYDKKKRRQKAQEYYARRQKARNYM